MLHQVLRKLLNSDEVDKKMKHDQLNHSKQRSVQKLEGVQEVHR